VLTFCSSTFVKIHAAKIGPFQEEQNAVSLGKSERPSPTDTEEKGRILTDAPQSESWII
jgi:hypothetical protein